MESENEVTVEEERIVIERTDVEESATEAKKEELNADTKGEGVANLKEASKPGTKSEGMASKAAANVSKSKISKPLKEPGNLTGRNSKNNKVIKDKSNLRSAVPLSRDQRAVLSQSLSFPARRVHGDGLMKSIDGYPEKVDLKHGQEEGTKVQASSNGSLSSLSRLNHPNSRGSIKLDSKPANTNGGGVTARRTTLASLPSNRQALPAKSVPGNVAAKSPSSSESADSKPVTAALLSKEDDDAHSTTSSATSRSTRRSSGSGFTFRLEERAEKRKEFFSKLEEKIHAKEVERNNLQAKSKENQEAEIKQLRKSLAFKATPMPSFYKEPPPKVELKKIPTTRAKSPKLGRHKSSVSATNNPSEGDGSSVSPSLNQEQNFSTRRTQTNGNEDNVASKKAVKKSQPKLQSKEITKAEENPGKSKPRTRRVENTVQDACVGKPEEHQNHPVNLPQLEDAVGVADETNPAKNGGLISSLANPETMPRQVPVGG
ncbi:PREDICTED: protein WVD2-like 4 isoform X1 [Theobroma cacao]|uniref:Protein WVD2-like 4 isoform X1 n=1 Tax=Theobroma cacao TaxID=3641 RepID=A0AB32WI20_THECC|nr:PREDICTED: protein WVD2-like 4 isoform X1 [Theobroma cacao]